MKETELVRAVSQGDLGAFKEVVLKYQDQALNQAYRLLGISDVAEDIT